MDTDGLFSNVIAISNDIRSICVLFFIFSVMCMCCRSLFVLFLLAIVLSVPRKSKNVIQYNGQKRTKDKQWCKKKNWNEVQKTKDGANSYGPKNQADHTPLVTPIVLLLNHTNMIRCEHHVGIFMGRRVKQKKTLKIPKG